jgi:hypothetical protein
MRQLLRAVPVDVGAVMGTEISYVAPDATELEIVTSEDPIPTPPVDLNLKPVSQAHDPEFCTFHVFVNASPGSIWVLSGIVTSLTNVSP